MLRFDPNLRWLFTELPMLDRYAAAARAGFKGVEVAFPYEYPAREIAARLSDNDLTLVQILTPCNWAAGERGIAALPGRQADFSCERRYRDRVCAGGRQAAGSRHGGQSGRGCRPSGVSRHVRREHRVRGRSCRARGNHDHSRTVLHCALSGLLLSPPGRRHCRHPRAGSRQRQAVLRYVPHPERGRSLAQRLRDAFPYIGHIQVGDVPGRQEPGTGEIRFPFVFEQIEALGWAGWIGCEFTPSSTPTEACLDWGRDYGIGVDRNDG